MQMFWGCCSFYVAFLEIFFSFSLMETNPYFGLLSKNPIQHDISLKSWPKCHKTSTYPTNFHVEAKIEALELIESCIPQKICSTFHLPDHPFSCLLCESVRPSVAHRQAYPNLHALQLRAFNVQGNLAHDVFIICLCDSFEFIVEPVKYRIYS